MHALLLVLKAMLCFSAAFIALLFSLWACHESSIRKATLYGKNYTPVNPVDVWIRKALVSAWAVCRSLWRQLAFSKEERQAYEAFNKIKGGESIWHYAIRNALHKGTRTALQKLISQLRSEAEPVPEMMLNLLGPEVFDLLIREYVVSEARLDQIAV